MKIAHVILHYLVPHESNNYRAKSIHHSAILFYIVLLLFFQSLASLLRYTKPNILGYATDISVEKILEYVNEERTKNGLQPLSISQELSVAATNKASDMFSNNYWAHISPTGTTPWEFINKAGYEYAYAGENLAKDFNFSDEVVKAWMNSPTHKANILKPEYTDIGLAVMNGELHGSETTLVVQEFGSKSKDRVIANKETTVNVTPAEIPPKEDKHTVGITAKTGSTEIPMYSTLIAKLTPRTISIIIAEFLLLVLFIDGIFIWKHRILRINGHTLSHMIFLAALIGAMSFTGIGVIL